VSPSRPLLDVLWSSQVGLLGGGEGRRVGGGEVSVKSPRRMLRGIASLSVNQLQLDRNEANDTNHQYVPLTAGAKRAGV
jgi:hypothetical protein